MIGQESMPQRNQRWVHLPLTICEALRTLGSEFSCLFPCKSSCFSTSEREKEERAAAAAGVVRSSEGNAGQSSCGAVFKWLVALQDGEGGGKGGRQIELVVGGDDDDNDNNSEERRREFMERGVRNSRRHIFDDLQIVDNRIELKDEGGGGGDHEARVSICIPPKNALLLMRCRSDPVKMEALTSKFWDSPALPKDDLVEEEEEEEEKERVDDKEFKDCEVEHEEEKMLVLGEVDEEQEMELKQSIEEENQEATLEINEELKEEIEDLQDEIENESMFLDCLFEEFVDEHFIIDVEDRIREEEAQAETTVMEDYGEEEEESEAVEELAALEFEAEESIEEKETLDGNFEDETEMVTHERSELKEEEKHGEGGERESGSQMKVAKEGGRTALPDCLLLMMCEPKLSMEVSRETWVCSTDFIRWQPERKKQVVKPVNGGDEPSKKTVNVDAKPIKPNPAPVAAYKETIPILHQPPRSSCSLPATAAAASMATMIEQKLVNAVGYEPFVLTRCKSEPMRNASKLVPETCFWKNRKLEPLRRAAYGVSASGLGF